MASVRIEREFFSGGLGVTHRGKQRLERLAIGAMPGARQIEMRLERQIQYGDAALGREPDGEAGTALYVHDAPPA